MHLTTLTLSLFLFAPLVHGGKGVRCTPSEDVYPEKGMYMFLSTESCSLHAHDFKQMFIIVYAN